MVSSSKSVFRNAGAVVTGLIVGSAINMSLIMLNVNYLYPMPHDVSFEDTQQFGDYIANLPLPAFLVVFCAHFGQSVVGGYVAAVIGTRPVMLSHVIGLLTLMGSVANNLQIPVPYWTWIEIPLYPVLAHQVGKYVQESKQKQLKEKE